MRSAAVRIGKSGATIAGDLPPSSSVTGVRLRAALAITDRPVALDPVKIRWSNGSDENAGPSPPESPKNASFVSGKYFGAVSTSSSARRREFSDILTIARLPAAKMLTSGEKASRSGKFHGTITPTTPSGCGMTRLRAPGKVRRSTLRRRGFIQLPQSPCGVVNGGLQRKDLGEQRLELASIAEVGADRLNDRRLVFADHARECLEVGETLGMRSGSGAAR